MACLRIVAALLASLLATMVPHVAVAQSASPSLVARVAGVNDPNAQSRKLAIETLDVEVRMQGAVADTVVTARFANAGQQILEGEFTLAMPFGAVVTGYALDVNGRMVDGVLADQRQARMAYEARLRQRIDPGLGEVSRDNVFRTRVFPIMPSSGRTIRLHFSAPVDPRLGYQLPFRGTEEIGSFNLSVTLHGAAESPGFRLPDGVRARWVREGQTFRLTYAGRGTRLDGALAIAAPRSTAPMLVSRHPNGELFFQIAGEGSGGAAARPRRVAILWDRSLSRADDRLADEIALVRRYLESVQPDAIELILFDSQGAERVQVRDAAAAAERLGQVRYRGATSYAGLAAQTLNADLCLLVSDGLVTVDARDAFGPTCPMFAISSGADADRPYLTDLTARAGGELIDLTRRRVEEGLARLTRPGARVAAVTNASGRPVDFAVLDGGERGWRIVGPLPAGDQVQVRLAGGEARPYQGSGEVVDSAGAGALWAAQRVAAMANSDTGTRDDLVRFSRNYSVASPDVSFIVLETGRDYAMARIDPPATLPPEWMDDYRRTRDAMKEQETRVATGRLERVVTAWNEMKAWWATRFDPARRPAPRRDNEDAVGRGRGTRNLNPLPAPPAPPPPPPPPPPAPTAPPPVMQTVDAADAITVTGSRVNNPQLQSASPASTAGGDRNATRGRIALEPWAPNRPYLQALDAAAPADFDRVFAEQQARHGVLPAFWLDVADWAFRKGRRADATAWVLSALELPTRNNQTLEIVADRLMRYGEMDRAIWLYERLLAAEGDRPQPHRTLALALARRAETLPADRARADLGRAIQLLSHVVLTPWNTAYNGIEMIALMDVNRLIPRHRRLGGTDVRLDPRLIALLDVDIRVLIEWGTEATDVDLWVDEPSGERAIFHRPRTSIGGRLSNDMTAGYGPEEYLLRRAIPGDYQVRANVFSADRINPNGAQRVTARIIRDWGRASEREEIVDIELLPNDTTRERRVGTITIGR